MISWSLQHDSRMKTPKITHQPHQKVWIGYLLTMLAGCYGAVGGRYVLVTNVVKDVNMLKCIGMSLWFVLLLALALA